MKVVLDTNVIVSGTFWTGNSFKVLELVNQEDIVLIITLPILQEYDRIIHSEEIMEKTTIYQQRRIQALQKILSKATIVEPKERIEIIKNDPDDNKFLEAAIEAKADYIISQDKHLFIIKEFRNIKIIKPEEFLNLF